MEHKGFEVPNHTQTPNTFFDVSLPEIKSLTELKVVLAVIRQTFGWQKKADRISLSQLQRLTGLSRESVSIGIQAALEHKYIERKAVKNGFVYNLKVVRNSDQSGIPTSQEFRPKVVRNSDQKVVGIPDPQKKEEKEKKESSAHALLMDFHFKRIGKIPDGKAQGGAAKWILDSGFSSDQAIGCYEFQLSEDWRRGMVSWLTVKTKIGAWVASRRQLGNGRRGLTSADLDRMGV